MTIGPSVLLTPLRVRVIKTVLLLPSVIWLESTLNIVYDPVSTVVSCAGFNVYVSVAAVVLKPTSSTVNTPLGDVVLTVS